MKSNIHRGNRNCANYPLSLIPVNLTISISHYEHLKNFNILKVVYIALRLFNNLKECDLLYFTSSYDLF